MRQRALAALSVVILLAACGTVDLENDPLLKPPQLIDSDIKNKKKTSAALPAAPTALG